LETIEDIAQNIEDYVSFTSQLEMICKCYKISLDASPLSNFRDALSHYILRYDATTDEEKLAQEISIKEHLFRGAKDIYVLILHEMIQKTSDILKKATSRDQERDYRKILHEYKKLELEIRRNTESDVIRILTPFVEKLNDLIEKAKIIMGQYGVDFP
jgi:hypothetical protein